jgi:hypothetical protein
LKHLNNEHDLYALEKKIIYHRLTNCPSSEFSTAFRQSTTAVTKNKDMVKELKTAIVKRKSSTIVSSFILVNQTG